MACETPSVSLCYRLVETYDSALSALADPTRRAILELLREGPRSVGELAEAVPVTRPAVSQHLAVLRHARLVTEERQGTRHIYRAQAEGLQALRAYLEDYWGEVLSQFVAEAKRERKTPSRRRKRR